MRLRLGRLPLATGLVLAVMTLPMNGAAADPQPTVAQAKAKLAKLNEQADKVVDRYNGATERYKKSKSKYDTLNGDLKKQEKTVEGMRHQLITVAVSAYQGGDLSTWPGLMSAQDPGGMLNGLAAIDQLSASREKSLDDFDAATKKLREQRDGAKDALEDAQKTLDEVRDEKKKVEGLVSQQMKLLRRLDTYNPGNPNGSGQKYTGNASGNAREVLNFAFAQLGKPYRYGGTGPDGYDCSGLTQAAWRAGGVSLPRTTYSQWAWGASRKVSMDALQPGDLLFSNGLGHVGIFIGGGKMLHAPQTGDVIKVTSLSAYGSGFVGAVRP